MELAAAKRRSSTSRCSRHFEQNLHVRHRLERYGAGRARWTSTSATPDALAAALADALAERSEPAAVERDGAATAAADRGAAVAPRSDQGWGNP